MRRTLLWAVGVALQVLAALVAVGAVAGIAGDLGAVELVALLAAAVALAVAGHRLRTRHARLAPA